MLYSTERNELVSYENEVGKKKFLENIDTTKLNNPVRKGHYKVYLPEKRKTILPLT